MELLLTHTVISLSKTKVMRKAQYSTIIVVKLFWTFNQTKCSFFTLFFTCASFVRHLDKTAYLGPVRF